MLLSGRAFGLEGLLAGALLAEGDWLDGEAEGLCASDAFVKIRIVNAAASTCFILIGRDDGCGGCEMPNV